MKKLLLLLLVLIGGSYLAWQWFDREQMVAQGFDGASSAPVVWDASFVPTPVSGYIEAHPGLAPIGQSTMHADGFQSDTHPPAGPMGTNLEVRSRISGSGTPRECATFVFRSDGKLVSLCGGFSGFRIVLIDPDTLGLLASYDLPMRPSSFEFVVKRSLDVVFSDTSGGAYLFMDNKDRVVFGDSLNRIIRLKSVADGGKWRFEEDGRWDMSPYFPHDCFNYNNLRPTGECDKLTTVMPDHQGRYWWVTRNGRVGTLDPVTGKVALVALGEEIQNAISVDKNATYVLTDHAQYAFVAGADGKPVRQWREAYDRGTKRKVGSVNQGSGTTPTLIGDRYITYTDNADVRMNLVVLRRGALAAGETRQICKLPLFKPGASTTDNSMIAIGRSIVLENNSGFTTSFTHKDWTAMPGGVVRVDIREDESGCDIVWESPLVVPSVVAKLSLGNGIAYFYSFDWKPGQDAPDWSLAGLDFATGKQVLKVPTGRGSAWDNNWSEIAIAPNGDLYVGSPRGMIQVRKKPPA
jgi:sugar lactone lactonase YvrE